MRDNGITIGKALAIMLMVLGHTRFSPPGISFIYMFHIPAFFFFSGYCFKEKYMDAPVKSFIVKRINGLWLPFVKYGLLFLLLHNVFFHLNIYNDVYGYNGEVSRIYDVKDFVAKAIHIVFTMTGEEQLLGAFWFLRTLLWSSVIGYGILRFRNQELKLVLWGGVILLASYLLLLADLRVPFFAIGGRELLATFFFLVGVAYKRSGFSGSALMQHCRYVCLY